MSAVVSDSGWLMCTQWVMLKKSFYSPVSSNMRHQTEIMFYFLNFPTQETDLFYFSSQEQVLHDGVIEGFWSKSRECESFLPINVTKVNCVGLLIFSDFNFFCLFVLAEEVYQNVMWCFDFEYLWVSHNKVTKHSVSK